MQDLTPVGLNEDRTTLVLVDEAGVTYTVAADARLRAALGGDETRPGRSNPGQLEKKMDSVLRPRDIQARIRGGESPEAVASAAQTTVDKIMGFAAPVMAERAYIAEQAQKASVRRRAGDGPAGHLAETVASRLGARHVPADTVSWDAWRRENGRWTVVADFGAGESASRATFVYDVAGRYVVAEDDEAKSLVGERAPGASGRAFDEGQLRLGDDAIQIVTGVRPPADEPADTPLDFDVRARDIPARPQRRTLGSTGTGTGQRQERERPAGDESLTEDLTDAAKAVNAMPRPGRTAPDWMETQASDRPTPPAAPVQRSAPPTRPAEAESTRAPEAPVEPPADRTAGEPAGEPAGQPAAQAPASSEAEAPSATEPPARRTPPTRKAKGKGRPSVPSWDEIMFGSGKPE